MSTFPLVTRAILTNNDPIVSQGVYAVAVPPIPALGTFAVITDSPVNTNGATITVGGGGFTVLACSDGTHFRVVVDLT